MYTTYNKKQTKILVSLLLLTFIGCLLRILSCYWGYPYHLHCDEPTIVANATDMISRHSWEVNVFNRPDHFEIKCCAILFQIISLFKYHTSADIAYINHEMTFYLIARGFTVIFGTIMIPLTFLILEKIKKGSGILGAILTTFFAIFIDHSSFATPDIVLTFTVMLITYVSILYLEMPTFKKIIIICIMTGLGITIKYTCAICCLWIAFIIILECIKNNNYIRIIKYGFIAASVVIVVSFFMAPNLFTNLPQTIAAIKIEARSTHLGADGLGIIGNTVYYLTTFLKNMGLESVPFLLFGLAYLITSKKAINLSIGLGMLFWICTSILPLHWERWGMPIYIFYIFIMAIGMSYTIDIIRNQNIINIKSKAHKYIILVYIIWSILLLLNIILSGICVTKSKLLPDTRIIALNYCINNGITSENSMYEGYTPFLLRDPATIAVRLNQFGKIQIPNKQKKYIILSSFMYNRYYLESKRYIKQVAVYDAINSQCRLLKKYTPYIYHSNYWIIPDIIEMTRYIMHSNDNDINGPTILIFRISNNGLKHEGGYAGLLLPNKSDTRLNRAQ